MSNLQQVLDDIRSEIQILPDGRGVASIRAVARLCDVQPSSLTRQFKGVAQTSSKMTEMLIGSGFDSVALETFSQDGVPDIAIAIILEYYGYDAGRYCTEQARKCCRAFRAIGVRHWMQQIVGWTQQSSQTQANSISTAFKEAVKLAATINRTSTLDKATRLHLIRKVYSDAGIELPVSTTKPAVTISCPNSESHLVQWMNDIQLVRQTGSVVTLKELWEQLKKWYAQQGLKYKDDGDRIRPIGLSEVNFTEPIVTGKRVLKGRLMAINPNAEIRSIEIRHPFKRQSILPGWAVINPLV